MLFPSTFILDNKRCIFCIKYVCVHSNKTKFMFARHHPFNDGLTNNRSDMEPYVPRDEK